MAAAAAAAKAQADKDAAAAAAQAAQVQAQVQAQECCEAAAASAAQAAAARAETARWQQTTRAEQEAAAAARAERDAARDIADEWSAADDPAHALTSFADANFTPQYEWVARVKPLQAHQKDRVLCAVRRTVELYCEGLYADPATTRLQIDAGRQFIGQLQDEWRITDDADLAAERVWTSQKVLVLHGAGDTPKEFCFIFSAAIRADRACTARACAILARGLKTNLVGAGAGRGGVYPPGGECWRGGGFDDQHRGFFEAGKKYRVPGFLATSLRKATTNDFMDRAAAAGDAVVLWRIVFDARGDPAGDNDQDYRCKHVNQLRVTHVAGESEFLFQAFSVFTVVEVQWSAVTPATRAQPHRITLAAAIDNALEPEDLPLAPWS